MSPDLPKGRGLHQWAFVAALDLYRQQVPPAAIETVLRGLPGKCGAHRPLTEHEIADAVSNAPGVEANAAPRIQRWPAVDVAKVTEYGNQGGGLAALESKSGPVPGVTAKVLLGVVQIKELVCLGKQNPGLQTKPNAKARSMDK